MRAAALTLASSTLLLLAACGGSSDPADPTEEPPTGLGATQSATLADFSIAMESAQIPAGTMTFKIQNDGPSTHEFEVIATDLAPGALPVDSGVANTEGLEIIDEIEDIVPGPAELTVDLVPGSYVIICNLSGHYEQGMHAGLTVA